MIRGYIYTKGKKPLSGECLTHPDYTPHTEPPEHGDYAGVLNDDIVKVDIDKPEHFQKAIKMVESLNIKCNILETSRGGHLYFRNKGLKANKINWYAACGLYCEWKLGIKNETCPVRVDGVDRQWLKGSLDNADIDELPAWLMPISKKQFEDFESLDENSGRNDVLYRYILKLAEKLSKEEIKTAINLVNQFMLASPLQQREIDTITRDEAFPAGGADGKFNHAAFGDELISELHLISVNGCLYSYSDGVYLPKDNDDMNSIIINRMPELKINQRRETIEFMKGRCAKKVTHSNLKRVNVKNGILEFVPNKETNTFDIKVIDHSPQIIDFKQFNAEYNPDIEYPLLEETLKKVFCDDEDIISLFDEIIGYLMMNHVNYHKAFFFIGKPSGGKSNILKMIINFLGKHNVSTLSLKDFNDKFRLSNIVNKTANILADLEQTTVTESGNFKSLVTGDGVLVEEKYGKSFTYYNTAKLLFGCNTLPHFIDKAGVMRRPIIIPFKRKFSKSDADFNAFIDEDLSSPECMSALLNRGIEGYKRLYINGGFTEPAAVQKELEKFKVNNSNVLTWMTECEYDEERLQREFIKDLYKLFTEWCLRNNNNPQSRRSFVDEICNEYEFSVKQKRIPASNERDSMFVK